MRQMDLRATPHTRIAPKPLIWLPVLVALLLASVAMAEDAAPPLPLVDGEFATAILVDARSGMPLAGKDPDERWQPASMLKMMTELIVLEHIEEGDMAFTDTITVSARASRMGGSQVYLAHNERFTVEELLTALAVHSANDAAVSLAEHTAGSVEAFVDLMNYRARDLGMVNSEFHSVHGLPAGRGQQADFTTARDMAILGRALLAHPEALVWSSMATAPFRNGEFTLYNPNKLVGKYRGLDGLKTGYHGQAGYCVTATAVQKDVRLLSVVMGCPTDRSRATETTRLLSYGFNQFQMVTVIDVATDVIDGTVAVEGGKTSQLALVYADQLQVAVPRDREADIELRREVSAPLEAPVGQGEKVGEVVAVLDGFELGRVDVLAAETVEEGNWLHRLFH